jgi:hypothetical protein
MRGTEVTETAGSDDATMRCTTFAMMTAGVLGLFFSPSPHHLLILSCRAAEGPCVSGTPVGQRPGPYSFLIATGPQRGQSFCYICDTAERPAAVVFARRLSEPLGKLLLKFDESAAQPKDALRSWMTVLGEKTIGLDDLAKWSKEKGLKSVPVGVFDDQDGPPSYQLSADAEVTVLLFVNKKVVANFAFRAGEMNDAAVAKVVEALPKLMDKKD